MMIEAPRMILDCVIGHRSIANTTSSLWPFQNRSRTFSRPVIVFFVFVFLQVGQVMGEETVPSVMPPAAESVNQATQAPMTDIHDILPPVQEGLDMPWLWVPAIIFGVIGLAVVAWWLWKKYRKKRPIETIVPELPPEMVARQALDQISDVRGMNGKTFYFRLSAILRRYVFGRFGVGAPEMTTEEFLPCIDRLNINPDLVRDLKGLCRAMDPVKFGGQATSEKQMETDLFFARDFVRKTTQQAETESENNNGERNVIVPGNHKNARKQIPNLNE